MQVVFSKNILRQLDGIARLAVVPWTQKQQFLVSNAIICPLLSGGGFPHPKSWCLFRLSREVMSRTLHTQTSKQYHRLENACLHSIATREGTPIALFNRKTPKKPKFRMRVEGYLPTCLSTYSVSTGTVTCRRRSPCHRHNAMTP